MNENKLASVKQNVSAALEEDVGEGDITAQLIPADKIADAVVITRDKAVICGSEWVNEVFAQLSSELIITWHVKDGDVVEPNDRLFSIRGPARPILTGERSALNFLQTLSGTATVSRQYADLVAHTTVKLLDTRKTLPGLRLAQKYAVKTGGCFNHRIGLFDAFLIKENHIFSCGSISRAIKTARELAPEKPVEIEVESLEEFDQALTARADIIMLDNFSISDLKKAVTLNGTNPNAAKLEASGGITNETIIPLAETGVDFISIGALTKDCRSIDLSMRISLSQQL